MSGCAGPLCGGDVAVPAAGRAWFGRVGCGEREVGVCDHREGDVPIPGQVLADLVVVQADLVLGGLEALLGAPSGSSGSHELGQGNRPGWPSGDRTPGRRVYRSTGGPVPSPGRPARSTPSHRTGGLWRRRRRSTAARPSPPGRRTRGRLGSSSRPARSDGHTTPRTHSSSRGCGSGPQNGVVAVGLIAGHPSEHRSGSSAARWIIRQASSGLVANSAMPGTPASASLPGQRTTTPAHTAPGRSGPAADRGSDTSRTPRSDSS
jgi:hypothetical protein